MKRITQSYLRVMAETRITQEKVAELTDSARRTVQNYLAEESLSTPMFALRFSKATSHPEITYIYCREECPIGQAYCYEYLDQVCMDPVSALAKLGEEHREFDKVYNRLLSLAINKRSVEDFTKEEWRQFEDDLQEMFDLEHNIEMLKIAFEKWIDISPMIARHNQKCIERRYATPAPRTREVKEKTASGKAAA